MPPNLFLPPTLRAMKPWTYTTTLLATTTNTEASVTVGFGIDTIGNCGRATFMLM